MSTNWDYLTDQALALPISSRAELAKRLIESLDGEKAEELRQQWAALATQRWNEIDAGQVECRDADDVFRQAREHLQ